jgi:uncharacterized membrane protein YhaH (DUF805 family)
MSAPNYVTYYMLLSSIAIITAALAGLRVAVGRADWEQSQRVATLRTATILLPLWFAAAAAASYAGAFRGTPSSPPTIEFGIFVPVIVGLLWLWRSATAMRLLDAVPQSWLVGLQFYRVLGAIFGDQLVGCIERQHLERRRRRQEANGDGVGQIEQA